MDKCVGIRTITLSNYRNHKFLKLNTKKNIILIHGKNGSGKTNILESISLLDSGSGLKNASLADIINSNLVDPIELFAVNFMIFNQEKSHKIGLGLKKKSGTLNKIIKLEKKISCADEIKNLISIFWIVPKMSFIFQVSSEERRNFLDSMISSIDKFHKKRLQLYEKYKKERITILKKSKTSMDSSWLNILEKKMSQIGIMICDSRRSFLKSINSIFSQSKEGMPKLNIRMIGELDIQLQEKPALEVEEFFCQKLKKNRQKDAISGRTNFGVNKTDIQVKETNKKKLAETFSTGEQKVIVITILFSFLRYLKKINFTKVIFLLDDIFSFLDIRFTNLILEELKNLNLQTWITDVRADWVEKNTDLKSFIDKINIDEYRFKVEDKLV